MSTAQMTQTAPNMINDVRIPMAQPPAAKPFQPQIVHDLPVQNPNEPKPSGFSPIMSSEGHDQAKSTASDHVLHEASHAVQAQPAEPEAKKRLFGKKSATAKTSTANKPKPILETVLLITGCLIACGAVAVLFSGS